MMMFTRKSVFLLQICLLSVNGWTIQPQSKTNNNNGISSRGSSSSLKATTDSRRDFVRKSGIATTSLVGSFLFPEIQQAAAASVDKVYKVAPNSLIGKTIVITGGTTGLGLESAKRLAAGGATVILTSRTAEKGQKAVQEVKEYVSSSGNNNNNVYSAVLDLDDLKSVESFPGRYRKVTNNNNKIDVLMNNAGVMAVPKLEMTKDGYERTFQSNHLGHFVLTAKLYSDLSLASDARIINVSSEAYNFASITGNNKQGLDLDNLNGEREYNGWKAYGTSKLANIMFTQELQRRLDEKKSAITVYTLHPGAVNTDLARNFVGEEKFMAAKEKGPQTITEKIVDKTVRAALKSVEEGASTQIYLAGNNNNNQKAGEFYVDYKPENLPAWAKDETKAKALWEKSEQLTGVSFKL